MLFVAPGGGGGVIMGHGVFEPNRQGIGPLGSLRNAMQEGDCGSRVTLHDCSLCLLFQFGLSLYVTPNMCSVLGLPGGGLGGGYLGNSGWVGIGTPW